MKKLIIVSMIVMCSESCRQSIDTKAEGEKLMEVSRAWSKVAASREIEKTLSYWSDDAVVISGGDATMKGKDAIRAMVKGSYENPSFQISWEPRSVDISASGDMGYLLEDTQIIVNDSTGKPVTSHYNSITVWKKQRDGSWKNVLDVLGPVKSK